MTLLITIHYQDRDLLIVEKPAGIPTQPLPNRRGAAAKQPPCGVLVPGRDDPAHTLASLLIDIHPELKSVGGSDWGAVHRLDIDTSGIVVFARNQKTYDCLREDFSKNKIEKEYTALVQGVISEAGEIHWPIGSDPKSKKRVKFYRNLKEARRHRAQEAITLYWPLTSSKQQTLLRLKIQTGRRHQIRAHLAAIGHPIVGDTVYGGPEASRLHLHASRLKLNHPRTGEPVEVHSEPSFDESSQ